jgi:tRNA(Arg) A34 adenosine deaminase TadA
MHFPTVNLALPEWVGDFLSGAPTTCPGVEARMELTIELARRNVSQGTGGPFGAAIFNLRDHSLLAPGVNLVVGSNCAVAHAEMMAIMIGQAVLGSYDLGGEGFPPFELVTSTEPCAMCFGAIPWSGVRRLVCGARREDAELAGFDEGCKPLDWDASLQRRGIEVVRDVCRPESAAVLFSYAASGGIVYNGRRGGREGGPE